MARSVVVVSGLPRSGTSMMMKMLEAGGLSIVTDNIRTADDDNPRGYYELEAVKQTRQDPSWVEAARGRAVKVISQLLQDLPPGEQYKVVFMRRRLDEVLASQRVMLERRGEQDSTPDDDMKSTFAAHVEEVEAWMQKADHVEVLYVSYNRMTQEPRGQVERLLRFLGLDLDADAMVGVVDPSLYRQRSD